MEHRMLLRRGVKRLITPTAMVTIWSLVALLAAALTYAFPVWPDDGSGSTFKEESGNAVATWIEVHPYGNYPYWIEGEAELQSGNGVAYYGSDVSWETSSGEVNGGTVAVFKSTVEYDEEGDQTGKDHAYLWFSFRVYKWAGSAWDLVGHDTRTVDDQYSNSYESFYVYHSFDSSLYKFRFIQKAYVDEPQSWNWINNEITYEQHWTNYMCLYIDDD